SIGSLIQKLSNPNSGTVRQAIQALEQRGRDAKPALSRLKDIALNTSDSWIQESATKALGNLKAYAPELVPELIQNLKESQDPQIRKNSAFILRFLKAKEAVPQLILSFQDVSPEVRTQAAYAIGALGEEAKEAVPYLTPLFSDTDEHVRMACVQSLEQMGWAARPIVPQMARLLQDKSSEVRLLTAVSLSKLKYVAWQAAPELGSALRKDSDTNVRWYAAQALNNMGSAASPALSDLIKALKKDDSYEVREEAAEALGNLEEAGKPAISILKKALAKDNSARVRERSAKALGRLAHYAKEDVKETLGYLTHSLLKDDDFEVRKTSLDTLGLIAQEFFSEDSEIKNTVSKLQNTLKYDGQLANRMMAAMALGELRHHSKKAIPDLIQILEDPSSNPSLRWAATRGIMTIGGSASSAIPALKKLLLTDLNEDIRKMAAKALGRMFYSDLDKEGIAAILRQAIAKDTSTSVQLQAALSLKNLGVNVKDVVLPFVRFLEKKPYLTLKEVEEFEDLVHTLTEEEKEAVNENIKNILYKANLPHLCETLCGLVKNAKQWIGNDFLEYSRRPEWYSSRTSWGFAIQTLGALFIAKAAPLCPEAKEEFDKIVRDMSKDQVHVQSAQDACPSSLFPNLQAYALPLALVQNQLPIDSPVIYGKQFYSLLLKDILKKDGL
ncbi:MAG: HEAT repeat domain-containing protein, partial [Deltaproteobacteria bacterium]|nr:HEAT repeat domain-containing protein [Deltaproteobacteria bacterium]